MFSPENMCGTRSVMEYSRKLEFYVCNLYGFYFFTGFFK